jgi:DNA-binding transcriptional LysR family regulator
MATTLDLNLLHALDAILQEASVTKAAARAHLTTPAMSRALGRLRDTLGDPVLVRAGRSMVLTPFASALRARAHAAAVEVTSVLSPSEAIPIATLERTLVVRSHDAIAAVLCEPLEAAARREAPGFRLRFAPEDYEDAAPLRDGRIDLDVGVIDLEEPELRRQLLFRDGFVGVVRKGHVLARGKVTPKRFAACHHIAVSRRGRTSGPVDLALEDLGLRRVVAAIVPHSLSALLVATSSDLVTSVPATLAHYAARTLPIHVFDLPLKLPSIAVSEAWHPRVERDPAHIWLRKNVRAVLAPLARGRRRDA